MPEEAIPAASGEAADRFDRLAAAVLARFAGGPGADVVATAAALLERLRQLRERAHDDPFSNPILLLALEVARRLEARQLDLGDLERLTQFLAADGFVERARRLGAYLGETDPERNDARLAALFARLAEDGDAPFERFRARCAEEVFGIVFTAHPTFNLSGTLMEALAALAAGRDRDGAPLDETATARLLDRVCQAEHRPDEPLTLAREQELTLLAVAQVQAALRRATGVLLDVARRLYPERWAELTPRLVTIASWVGYDLDGRSDIGWVDILRSRLRLQRRQLAFYLAGIQDLRDAVDPAARDALDLTESRLALALNQVDEEIAVFGAADDAPGSHAAIETISRRMYETLRLRLTSAEGLVGLVDRALAAADDGLRRRLMVLRAELDNLGLGMAHTHVRLNATQVHNAIRKAVGLTTAPNDPRARQSYLDRIDGLLDQVRPMRINFGSLLAERTSVRQVFMVVAQMLKYGDRTAPVRILIAECESAFTLLTALYYARLFGCADRVDISPLFETEKALEAGSRMIELLLRNRHYRAYVEQRGRLCVQTGFSDAGRYIGQTPAAASIERLRLRLIRVMANAGLEGVQLLIFDTHGEAIGRGGHPRSFAERLAYVDTPATRRAMAEAGLSFKQEVSFQGGDGLLPFVNPALAYAALTCILEHALTAPAPAEDRFYQEAAYVREFFTTVKEFQTRLMADPNYGALLSAFGPNLLFPSGSRATRRQHEEPVEAEPGLASQLRAIPNNAILQQLGLLANSIGGVGAAIARDPDRFAALYAASPRLRQLMGIVEYGVSASEPQVMRAYIDTLDPHLWIVRAGVQTEGERREAMTRLADALDEGSTAERQSRVFRRLRKDFVLLAEGLRRQAAGAPAAAALPAGSRDRLLLLQALRLAAIHEIFLLATRIPDFSPRHGVTLTQLVHRLLHLDVPGVATLLAEIFPQRRERIDLAAFGEPADDPAGDDPGYEFEHERIFQPLLALHAIIRRISVAVVHRIGFFG